MFIWFCPGSKKEEKTEIATHLIFDESDPKDWLDPTGVNIFPKIATHSPRFMNHPLEYKNLSPDKTKKSKKLEIPRKKKKQ